MKKIINLGILLCCVNIAISQNVNQPCKNLKNKTIEKFDVNKYRDLPLDSTTKFFNKPPNIPLDIYLKQATDGISVNVYLISGGKKININADATSIIVREKDKNTPYKLYKYYSAKTNNLLVSGFLYDDIHLGLWKEYDEDGNLIKETDEDKDFQFTLNDLINKMKLKYNIDILDKKNVRSASRYESDKLHKLVYEIQINKHSENKRDDVERFIFDGTTGKLIERAPLIYEE